MARGRDDQREPHAGRGRDPDAAAADPRGVNSSGDGTVRAPRAALGVGLSDCC